MRGRFVVGTLLLAVGIAWILSLQGITIFPGGWGTWWPSILILMGIARMMVPPRAWFGAAILVGVGTLLQVWRLNLIPGLSWSYAGPIALVALGFALIAGALARRKRRAAMHAHWRDG